MSVNALTDNVVQLHQTLARQEFDKGIAREQSSRKMIDMRAVDRRFLSQRLFPLSSLRSYQKADEPLYCNQVRALYHQNRMFHHPQIDSSFSPVQTISLDLREKNVHWVDALNGDKQVVALKITHFVQQYQGVKLQKQQWDFFFKTHKETFQLVGKNMIQEKYFCIEFFDGNQMELTFPEEADAIIDSKFWDEWKTTNTRAADTYRTRIYPCFFHVVKIICVLYFPKPIRILDLGGGDGELAMELAKLTQVASVTIIDSNGPSTQLALRRAKCNCPFSRPRDRSKIDVITGDITKKETYASFEESFDLILLSGVVAQQVLTRNESVELLIQCKKLLTREGFVVIGSHSHPHLKAEDFEASYDVLNKTASFKQSKQSELEIEPFYVLRKR